MVLRIAGSQDYACEWVCIFLDLIHRWSSWRSHIFDKLQFNTDLRDAEDTLINMQALWANFNLKVANHLKLGFYNFSPLRRGGFCPNVLLIKEK